MKIHAVDQRSPEWYALRCGMPTASEFSKIITSTGDASKSASTYAITLAAELFAGKPLEAWEGNQWTERGRELEDEAIARYEFQTDAETIPVGFVTDDAGMTGCSPDRLVDADGLLEVKCLKAERHIQAILYFEKHEHAPPDYTQQTQGQMLICQRKWADLVFYHPDLPLLTIRQPRHIKLGEALMRGIAKVIFERDEVLAALRRRAA
jgi:putative phage-type endonuclease